MVSLHSGLPPGEVWATQGSTYRLPASAPVLAERFAQLGYETAAFIANPVLHAGIGFDRGFDTFYVVAGNDVTNSAESSAPALQRRLEPWLEAHREQPFFLYVHYLDPHSPYENPDMPDGRSPFFPDYHGHITGRDVYGLLMGTVRLEDPAADTAHLTALYDGEISYVDRHVGRLLALAEQRGDRDLLVALTSDHGEELSDHGGWNHALTLYDELVHVPLVLRWSGKLPRGKRVAAPVALLDLAPTLVAAAGGEVPRTWSGLDLQSPSISDGSRRTRPIFAERQERYDPLRVAVVEGGRKLILFDRRGAEALQVRNPEPRILLQQALRRLASRELYDLARDPREQTNLAVRGGGGDLEVRVHRYLDAFLPGLRIVARGLEPGAILEAELDLETEPERWRSLFLEPSDRVDVTGKRVRVRLEGDGWIKGVLLEGENLDVRGIRILDTSTVAAHIVAGSVLNYRGGPIRATELRVSRWPLDREEPALGIWLRASGRDQSEQEVLDEETARRLRALGYAE
jgi:arylsulfatase A-like enzyme